MQVNDYKKVPQDAPHPVQYAKDASPEEWMSIPVGSNCPRGLEYLTVLDQVFVSQKICKLESITGIELKNHYKVKNGLGQNVYLAYEESSFCARTMLGSTRPFGLKLMDSFQNEVMQINRPFRCDAFCCFPMCLSTVEVSSPPGQVIGNVEAVFSIYAKYEIKNSFGDVVLYIEGPNYLAKCFQDVPFKVLNVNREQIGEITKKWLGLGESFTGADYFKVTFPLNLDVRMKAAMLAAVFLIDLKYYEK